MGVRAGYDNFTVTYPDGSYNTIIGNLAGEHNTIGKYNCFYGKHAGWDNRTGDGNVYIGDHCGTNSISHYQNTCIGLVSGENNTGNNNVMLGVNSGHDNTGHKNILCGQGAGKTNSGDTNILIGTYTGFNNSGDFNIIFGQIAGWDNTGDTNVVIGVAAGNSNTGNSNCFVGTAAGYGNTGDYNTYIGHRANTGTTNFYNTTALGANTVVTASNTMILGDNNVNVGIGLSGDNSTNPGPLNKLEINSSSSFTYTGIDGSGLRFRQLTSSGPYSSPNGYALTVDGNGDVILVPEVANNFGAECFSPAPYNLTDDWRVGLVNNSTPYTFYFEGQHIGYKSNVAIGYRCDETLIAKLNVVQRKPLDMLSINLGNYSFAGTFLSIPDVNCYVSEGIVG